MKLWGTSDIGIFGAIINANPNAAYESGSVQSRTQPAQAEADDSGEYHDSDSAAALLKIVRCTAFRRNTGCRYSA